MFPLTKRKTLDYTFGVPTHYNNFHIGCDYDANYVELRAPSEGGVVASKGAETGTYINFYPDHDSTLHRYLHLSKIVKVGRVKEGEVIAITGNTGLSTNPHLHLDISRNKTFKENSRANFMDPEKYDWNYKPSPPPPPPPLNGLLRVKVIINNMTWEPRPMLSLVSDYYRLKSNGRLQVIFDPQIAYTSFQDIPYLIYWPAQEINAPDDRWMDKNLGPLIGENNGLLLIESPATWKGNSTNGGLKGWQYFGKYPVQMTVSCYEYEQSFNEPVNALYDYVRHELAHAFYQMSETADRTHEWYWGKQFDNIFTDWDYNLIATKLMKGEPMAQIKTQAKGASRRIILEAASPEEWKVLCKIYGKDSSKAEEVVNDA